MTEKIADTTVTHRVEHLIRRLDSLPTLPAVAVRFLTKLLQPHSSLSDLAQIVELDPVLAAKILSLMHRQGISFPDGGFSVRQVLDKLPEGLVRDAFFSIKVLGACDPNDSRTVLRKELVLHCLAVACYAEAISEILLPRMNSQMVHFAGLLHDIGKLALEETMPKSFARIVEEAKSAKANICDIEHKHLGLDHAIVGKRLAEKWHLPSQINLAIWLHHSDTVMISQNMPEAKIAQVIQLADIIVRQSGLGQSGSFDSPIIAEQLTQSLALKLEHIQQIRQRLPETVRHKYEVLGLDLPDATASYCDIVHTTAARLVKERSELSVENRQLQAGLSHFDFITEFLLSIDSATPPIDVAENFATRWQKFYQTGRVCVYLMTPSNLQILEAVVVESMSQARVVILRGTADKPVIPEVIAHSFAVLDAHDYIDWLFEQLDVDFDINQTKLLPLLASGKAVGAIVFELRYPADVELFQEKFRTVTSIAGSILDMASAAERQKNYAEQFAQFLSRLKNPQLANGGHSSTSAVSALSEMAAGAAHELNNPLSVISGRAQLLDSAEIDPNKKLILKQIQENTSKISHVIEDMMKFAKPDEPKPTRINVRRMLDKAVQLTCQRQKVQQLFVRIDIAEGLKDVFVDSAQIVYAISNVFLNSLESYPNQRGPIRIAAGAGETGDFVRLQIIDFGCGIDEQTLEKATQPFFSAKPAGRKRGMGLSHANRLIELNKGQLRLTSEPGSGTTVTIMLPCG